MKTKAPMPRAKAPWDGAPPRPRSPEPPRADAAHPEMPALSERLNARFGDLFRALAK